MDLKDIEPVIQEEPTGCGIACCAALAGVSYKQAKERANSLGIFAEDCSLWSDTQYIRTILNSYQINVLPDEVPFTSWDALSDAALLSIKWRKCSNKSFWHWVLFLRRADGSVVLDSKKALKSHVRKDFGRIKPKWFIPICTIR